MGVDDGVTSSKQKPETIYMSNKAISSHKNKIIQKPKLTHEKQVNVIIVICKTSAYG